LKAFFHAVQGHDPFAVAVEDEWAELASRLQAFVPGKLALEDRLDIGR